MVSIYIEYPDPDKAIGRLSGPCSNVCSFDAELVAIGEAFRWVATRFAEGTLTATHLAILTDARSVLQAIDGTGPWPKSIEENLVAA